VRPADALAVRCRASVPVRRSFYEHLARAVLGARCPAGVVFEMVPPEPIPRALVRPAWIVDDLRAFSRGTYEPLEFPPAPKSGRPPPGSFDQIGVLFPVRASVAEVPEQIPPLPPPRDGLLGPGGWLASQTFCVRSPRGRLWVARRFRYAAPTRSTLDARFDPVAAALAEDWSSATGCSAIARRGRRTGAIGWHLRSLWGLPRDAWLAVEPDAVARAAEVRWSAPTAPPGSPTGHAVVFGSSGAGKTTYLAHRAAEAIARGDRVVAIDLHGDLAPAICARLPPAASERILAVDAGDRPVCGIAALPGAGVDDRAAGLLVAAVKRLSADGTDVYWGFRMERIFDTFVRLVQESGGSLLDLYDLLTSDDRRDVARLATRRPELARFLDELGPVVRRTPDYLWPAAARLSKVALVPALAELLAPADGGLPIEQLVSEGRSLLVRIPFPSLGPEAATLAGTLVLARVFLGLARNEERPGIKSPVLLVVDEVQGFSPRLVAELLAESRKFGIRAVVATQYPERLVPEVRSAAAGASAQFVVFRTPPPSAAEAGAWLGLDRRVAERALPTLPPGRGVELDPETGGLRSLAPVPEVSAFGEHRWKGLVARTRREHGPSEIDGRDRGPDDPVVERLLLAVLAAEEAGAPLGETDVVGAALTVPGPPLDPALLADRWRVLQRSEWLSWSDHRCRLAPAGARWLGLGAPTLATRESAEHRRLLLRAFRIFARHGCRLEILRQGRFDTTLPDARFCQLPEGTGAVVPEEVARTIDRVRRTWAWRFFGGRDVYVEAEVSGALRPERIRHGWSKGAGRGVFVLFVVGDAMRARRVRTVLERTRVARDRAQVWTLPPTGSPKP
jgi:Type IV secretion-system coupling protein DNA-binding domain